MFRPKLLQPTVHIQDLPTTMEETYNDTFDTALFLTEMVKLKGKMCAVFPQPLLKQSRQINLIASVMWPVVPQIHLHAT